MKMRAWTLSTYGAGCTFTDFHKEFSGQVSKGIKRFIGQNSKYKLKERVQAQEGAVPCGPRTGRVYGDSRADIWECLNLWKGMI